MSLPVALLIGHLSQVSEADAIQYAKTVAYSNTDPAVTRISVLPFMDGYVYEVQEGGPGLAYLPSILRIFEGNDDPKLSVHIATGTRSVEVSRESKGLAAVLLPEFDIVETSEGIVPEGKMIPVEPDGKVWMISGLALFGLGGISLVLSLVLSAVVATVSVPNHTGGGVFPQSPDQLPLQQWPNVVAASKDKEILALIYANGKWEVKGDKPLPEDKSAKAGPEEESGDQVSLDTPVKGAGE